MRIVIDKRAVKVNMALQGIDTYQVLAERTGVHFTTISRMVTGHGFRFTSLYALADVLKVPPMALLATESARS